MGHGVRNEKVLNTLRWLLDVVAHGSTGTVRSPCIGRLFFGLSRQCLIMRD